MAQFYHNKDNISTNSWKFPVTTGSGLSISLQQESSASPASVFSVYDLPLISIIKFSSGCSWSCSFRYAISAYVLQASWWFYYAKEISLQSDTIWFCGSLRRNLLCSDQGGLFCPASDSYFGLRLWDANEQSITFCLYKTESTITHKHIF